MKRAAAILLLAFSAAIAQESAPPAPEAEDMDSYERLEALDAAQIKLATDAIRAKHAEAATLDETGLARALLRGLLDGFYPGAELTGAPPPAPAPAPFRAELLDGRVGYVRPGSLGTESIAQLDAALEDFNAKKAEGIVLDLRGTPESSDFPLAAEVCDRFVPAGTSLFSVVRPADKQEKIFSSSSPEAFQGVIVVLADEDTAGAAEAIAGALRRHARAMVVGGKTSGRAAEFTTLPLGGGHHLRYASAEVRVEGLAPLYPRGIEPDLEVAQSGEEKKAILDGALDKGMAAYVFETERARMNEAALVAGTNPEIDADETAVQLLDRPLQRAVDLVVAIGLFRKRD